MSLAGRSTTAERARGGAPPRPRRRRCIAALCALLLACAGAALLPVPDEQLAPLLARAARARGLAFTAPVRAWAVPRTALPGLLARETDRVTSPRDLRRASALLEALGLVPAGFDLRESVLSLEKGSLAGFYSPVADRLYVVVDPRGGVGDVLRTRSGIFIHELGHALQAQHSQLLRVAIGIVSEQDLLFALSALLEGDALYTELRDAELQAGVPMPSPDGFAERFAAQQAGVGRGVPSIVRETLLLPYSTGYRLVRGIVDRGGTAALDAALADPPLSSADLLHPERELESGRPPPLTTLEADPALFAPDPACSPVADASLGELGVRSLARAAGVDAADAARLAAGWDADHAWLLDCSGRRAVAWLIALGSPERARALAAVLGSAAPDGHSSPGLAVERRGRRVLLSAGLSKAGRRFLTAGLVPHRYPDLQTWLEAHPAVLERSRSIRATAAAGR